MADLPGLVEGAHKNVGLGHRFLKHVERTKLLLFVVDLNGFRFRQSSPSRSPFETVLALMKELELFNPDLSHRRALLCLNKLDGVDEETVKTTLKQMQNIDEELRTLAEYLDPEIVPETLVKFDSVVAISARDDVHVDHLIAEMRKAVDEERRIREEALIDPEESDFNVADFTFHATEKIRRGLL